MMPPRRMFRSDRKNPDRRRVDSSIQLPTAPDAPDLSPVLDLSKHVVFVPVHRFVDVDTYHCLKELTELGVRIDFSKGASAIDATRNILASSALQEGMDSLLFIDSDMMFSPEDAVKLLLSDEPVIAGTYAAKKLGNGQLNVDFADGTEKVKAGEWGGIEPVKSIGAGFLRVKCWVLDKLIRDLDLPLCRMADKWAYPFFMPLVHRDDGTGEMMYKTEDYAFCYRCRQCGITPKADMSLRLFHLGDYAYGFEEAMGLYIPRQKNLEIDVRRSVPEAKPDLEIAEK